MRIWAFQCQILKVETEIYGSPEKNMFGKVVVVTAIQAIKCVMIAKMKKFWDRSVILES